MIWAATAWRSRPTGAEFFCRHSRVRSGMSWRAKDGEVIGRITPDSGSHNTVVGSSGKAAYLAGLKSPFLTVADTRSLDATGKVGPFSASIRPFTVNGRETLCFVNINELLGFEVGDLTTGKKLYRVQVQGFGTGPTKRARMPQSWNRAYPG